MAETLLEFIHRRLRELDGEVLLLERRIDTIETERAMLRKAAQVARDPPSRPPSTPPPATRTGRGRISERTIKDAVMEVLETRPEGMKALDILDAINARLNANYLRTSLSPQLSRLKAEGRITLEGKVWKKTEAAADFTNVQPAAASKDEPEEDNLFR